MTIAFQLRCDQGRLQQQFQVSNPHETWASDVMFEAGSLIATVGWNTVGRPVLQRASLGFRMRKGVHPMTSLRAESINVGLPSQAFREGRCVIPVDVFYTKSRTLDGQAVTSSYESSNGRMLAFAALLRPEGTGLSVTVLTIPTGTTVSSTNGRMPAIVGEDDYDIWLDDTTDATAAIDIIRVPRDDLLIERSL